MKVSDAVVEAGCKAAAHAAGEYWPDDFTEAEEAAARNMIRAALEAALPMVVGEAVGEIVESAGTPLCWFAGEQGAPPVGTKLHTLTNLEDAS